LNIIATVCARGGSTGLPGKNIRPLHGKPMINWTIEQALRVPAISGVYVSTDDAQIAATAQQAGGRVLGLRPAELATPTAPKLPVIRHLVEQVEASGVPVDVIVDLDPTSPLREVADIEACLALLTESVDVVITAFPSEKSPYFNMVEEQADGNVRLCKPPATAVYGRQGAPPVFSMNASVYVWHRRTLQLNLWDGNVRLHRMPRERSIDVDSLLDFKLVEMLMQERLTRGQ
jgi:CMP-N,N'-diacetyllegionaminic acid synthase